MTYVYTEKINFYFSYSTIFKNATWYSIVFIWAVSCVQMQQFANISDTVTVHRQALTK